MVSFRKVLGGLIRGFTGALYGCPAVCALCGTRLGADLARESGVCQSCHRNLQRSMRRVCAICGVPVPASIHFCPQCCRQMRYFEAQRSVGVYSGDLKEAIRCLKYDGQRWLAGPLGRMLAEVALAFLPLDVVVPVPIDPGRGQERGFNQARDLAYHVSRHMDVLFLDPLLREERYKQQAGLGRSMRWENLEKSIKTGGHPALLGARVLLVDDVMTTGATLDEAARALRNAGAAVVYGVTVARTVG